MKYITQISMTILGIVMLCNWAGQETTLEGRDKHQVNFFGTLVPRNGEPFDIENISVSYLYKQIPVYEPPALLNQQQEKRNNNNNNNNENRYGSEDHNSQTITKKLNYDPRKGILTKLDLTEIHEISVLNPDEHWTYQSKNGGRVHEYIEITVISNDAPKNTKNNYLVEIGRKIIADQSNQAGPIEKEIPFHTMKKLIIKGYKYRNGSLQKTEDPKATFANTP